MSIPESQDRSGATPDRHEATSGILYVRASLKPFGAGIKKAGGVNEFLAQHFAFEELLVPYFMRARPFWEPVRPRQTNSGALGRMVAQMDGAISSRHPSHRFSGYGPRVTDVLSCHDEATSCFYPVSELAKRHDFSMLLLGCVEESPGFSTIHVVQNELGLSQKHLDRFLIRWDCDRGDRTESMIARESPGCSASFGKFYPAYERDGNFVRKNLMGSDYVFIPSARRALETERAILRKTPRFVECGRWNCMTCRLRLY